MRLDTLLSPGLLSVGHQLRSFAARAISAVEIHAARSTSGKSSMAKPLSDFFTDCASKLSTFIDIVLPTVTTRVRTNATTATITFSEALEATSTPASAFVFTPARTLSSVVVSGTTVVITGVGITAGDSVAYTKPTNGEALQDPAGNEVANFSGVLA